MAEQIQVRRYRGIIDLISAGAVLIGLIIVSYEIKQTNDIQSAQAVYQLNASVNRGLQEVAQDPEVAELFLKAIVDIESLSVNERFRYDLWIRSFLNSNESAWLFYKKGVIDDRDYAGWQSGLCETLLRPGFGDFLDSRRATYTEGFVDDVNEHCDR